MFNIKKFFSATVGTICLLACCSLPTKAYEKIKCDCIFSVGSACRPAQYLRKYKLRSQAAPLDWMMNFSLPTALHIIENKGQDFFEECKDTGETVGNCRVVRDTKNGITSIHHFSKKLSLQNAKKEFRNTMIDRAKKVDRMLKESDSIAFIANRQKDSLENFKTFIKGVDKLYPNKKITLINIYDTNDKKVKEKVLFNEKNLKIIEYRFDDASPDPKKYPSWQGNPFGWKEVIDHVKLSDKFVNKNTDFTKVGF